MSRVFRASTLGILLAALAAPAVLGPAARAEVAALPDGRGGIAGTIEIFDRDSQPWRFWSVVRTGTDPALGLNPAGDRSLDGPPSVAIDPATWLPEAVWSRWDGEDYEIVWSRFDGAAWTTVSTPLGPNYLFLTDDGMQDLDPRLTIDAAGNRRVAWWIRGGPVDRVVVSALPAGDTQWLAQRVVSDPGVPTSRPDLQTVLSVGTFIVAEENVAGVLSVVVFEALSLDGKDTQRETEPWSSAGCASSALPRRSRRRWRPFGSPTGRCLWRTGGKERRWRGAPGTRSR